MVNIYNGFTIIANELHTFGLLMLHNQGGGTVPEDLHRQLFATHYAARKLGWCPDREPLEAAGDWFRHIGFVSLKQQNIF